MILGQQCHTLALLPADQPDAVLLLSVSFPTGVAAQPSSTYKDGGGGGGVQPRPVFCFILVRPCVVVAFVLCFSSFYFLSSGGSRSSLSVASFSLFQGLIGSVRVLGRTLF